MKNHSEMNMRIVLLFAAVLLQEASANFLCFCNFLHPYGYFLYACPSQTSELIGIIYPPDNTDHYVDLTAPHCVAAFNAQAPEGWVAVYYNTNNVNKVRRNKTKTSGSVLFFLCRDSCIDVFSFPAYQSDNM